MMHGQPSIKILKLLFVYNRCIICVNLVCGGFDIQGLYYQIQMSVCRANTYTISTDYATIVINL